MNSRPRPPAAPHGERMNVLVTGVTSSVGLNLAHRLYHDTRIGRVVGVAYEPAPPMLARLDPQRFLYQQTNILKYRELKNLFHSAEFRKSGVTAVVHCAFINTPGARMAHRLNVEGTKRLLDECCETPDIRKFVFKGSDVVYKIEPDGPVYLDENAELNFDVDVDPWVKDRVDADMICRAKMDSPSLRVVVLRFSSIFGSTVGTRVNTFFDAPLQFRAMGFDPLVNLVHVSDVIQAFEQALFTDVKGIFNIAGGDTAPVSAIAEVAGTRLYPLPAPLLGVANWVLRRLGKTRYYFPVDRDRMRYCGLLDIAKARRVLGYEPHSFLAP